MSLAPVLKVVAIGAPSVGKSSLIHRICNHDFKETIPCSQDIRVEETTLKDPSNPDVAVRAEFWDCPYGVYESRKERLLDGAMATLILYSITDYETFSLATTKFFEDAFSLSPQMFIILVGCKTDLSADRAVAIEDAQRFAQSHNVFSLEVSAKDGSTVSLMLNVIRTRATHVLRARHRLFAVPSSGPEDTPSSPPQRLAQSHNPLVQSPYEMPPTPLATTPGKGFGELTPLNRSMQLEHAKSNVSLAPVSSSFDTINAILGRPPATLSTNSDLSELEKRFPHLIGERMKEWVALGLQRDGRRNSLEMEAEEVEQAVAHDSRLESMQNSFPASDVAVSGSMQIQKDNVSALSDTYEQLKSLFATCGIQDLPMSPMQAPPRQVQAPVPPATFHTVDLNALSPPSFSETAPDPMLSKTRPLRPAGSSRASEPVVYVEVSFGGRCGQIAVRQGDNALRLAEEFVAMHGLPHTYVKKLAALVHRKIDEFCVQEERRAKVQRHKESMQEAKKWKSRRTTPKPFNLETERRGKVRPTSAVKPVPTKGQATADLPDHKRRKGRSLSERGPVIGRLSVEVAPSKNSVIVIRKNDNVHDVVESFRRTFSLKRDQAATIEQRILRHKAKLGASVDIEEQESAEQSPVVPPPKRQHQAQAESLTSAQHDLLQRTLGGTPRAVAPPVREVQLEDIFGDMEPEKKVPMFNLDVAIGAGVKKRITVHQGEDPVVLAKKFVQDNALPMRALPRLIKLINDNVDSYKITEHR